jgi:hypothetical protein
MRTWSDPEPLVWARTAGDRVWDEDGRAYLDLYAGYAVAALGYCHPRVTEAIRAQAGEMTHCPSAHPSRIRAEAPAPFRSRVSTRTARPPAPRPMRISFRFRTRTGPRGREGETRARQSSSSSRPLSRIPRRASIRSQPS